MAYLQKFLSDDRVWRYSHGSHQICIIPLDIFNGLPIKRWKHNRPPDKERVLEIHTYMKESKRVDGLIYLACVDKELVCYESNHRREGLVGLTDVQSILVDILWDATDDMVKAEFMRLNKAVSVPELYVDDTAAVDVGELIRLRDTFCERYKALKVSTGRPNAPNFNSDMVMNEFHRVMKENKMGPSLFWERLLAVNTRMATRDRRKLSDKVIEKCEKSGCWLFAWSRVLDAKEFA
jgi:hypothetical protein